MGVVHPIDVTPEQHETILTLLHRHLPGITAWVYGSRAKWTSRPQSDLDLVVFAKPKQAHQVGNLREALEESDLPFRVDLFVWDEISDSFRENILEEHVELVSGRVEAPDWPLVTVEEFSEKVAMGPFGSSIKVETFVPDGIPVISGQHLHDSRVNDTPGYNFIEEDHAKRLSNSNVQRGDIVLTHRGNIGQVSYIPEDSQYKRYIISQSQFCMRCDSTKAIPEFVTYYFRSPEGQYKLLANASQVGVPSIAQPVTYLRTIEVPLPPIPEQRAIAHILGTLDDKIELNRRMNETLEAMARAIFKDWFVDFGPVRAKVEGRDPYLPSELWDLFPNEFDGEGNPAGWERYTLSDLAKHHRSSVSPSIEPTKIFEHYSIPAYDADANPSLDLGKSIKSNKTIVPEDAVLLSKLNPEINRVWLPNPKGTFHQITSTEFLAFTPLNPATRNLLYLAFKAEDFRVVMKSMVTGTSKSHQRVSPKSLLAQDILVADPQVLCNFDKAVRPFIDKLLTNRQEVQMLPLIRDLLLPKLMSGEVRIHEAKKLVEVATAQEPSRIPEDYRPERA